MSFRPARRVVTHVVSANELPTKNKKGGFEREQGCRRDRFSTNTGLAWELTRWTGFSQHRTPYRLDLPATR